MFHRRRPVTAWQSLGGKPCGRTIRSPHHAGDRVKFNSSTNRDGTAPSHSWALFRSFDWPEGVLENKVSHLIALCDAVRGVELPMYTHVKPALRVFPFRLGKRFERGRPERPDVAVNIFVLAVPFIRNKSKFCMVRE